MKAICVTSGGIDSISMGLKLLKDGYDVRFLHIDLKQKAELGEHLAVEKIGKRLGVPIYFVNCGWLGDLGCSSLTDKEIEVVKGMDSLEASFLIKEKGKGGLWTPARNVVLLAVASAYAERYEAEVITWGANQSEIAYPDNTQEFGDRFRFMLEKGCLNPPRKVFAPLYDKDKVEIIKWGYDNGFGWVYDYTCSCDMGNNCGECGCCSNRRFAFHILIKKYGIIDNQKYVNEDYFYEVYLADLKKRCNSKMWMYKYLGLV